MVSTTVAIVDSDRQACQETEAFLSRGRFEIRSFTSAQDFLEYQTSSNRVACILVETDLSSMSGLELLQELRRRDFQTPVVFMSCKPPVSTVVLAMESGAVGFIEKPVDQAALIDSISKAINLGDRQRARNEAVEEVQAHFDQLTPREREVMMLVVGGMSTKQIAHRLSASARTIEVHRANIMRKLQVGSLAELVALAFRAGICE